MAYRTKRAGRDRIEEADDLDPCRWWDKIKCGESVRDACMSKYDEMVSEYHGPRYEKGGRDLLKNHYFEFVALRIGKCAFDNPKIRVSTPQRGQRRLDAMGYNHALNRWVRDVGFSRLAEKLAVSYFFGHAVTLTSIEARPGEEEAEDPIYWPAVTEINPWLFTMDPCARSYEEATWACHAVVVPKKDLIAQAERENENGDGEWDLDMVRDLATGEFPHDYVKYQDQDEQARSVCYYNVWVPFLRVKEENTSEKGYHGVWLTLGYCQSTKQAKMLRKPRDFWGPRWGPYTVYGCYSVPGKPWPLAPLLASWRLVNETNDQMEVVARANRNYKRLIFVKQGDKKLQRAIRQGKNDWVYPLPNFESKDAVQYELAGATREMVQTSELFSSWLDSGTGLSEPQRGEVSGDATATENAIASVASSAREAWQVKKFYDSAERNLVSVLWYLGAEDRVAMTLGDETERNFEVDKSGQPIFTGGKITAKTWPGIRRRILKLAPHAELPPDDKPPIDEDTSKGIDDLEISIEIGSMGRKDEAAEKQTAVDNLTIVTTISQAMMMNPAVKWDLVTQDLAMGLGMPELPNYFDFAEAGKMSAVQTAGMIGGGGAGGQAAEQSHNQSQPMVSRIAQRGVPDSRSSKAAMPGNRSGYQASSGGQPGSNTKAPRQRGAA